MSSHTLTLEPQQRLYPVTPTSPSYQLIPYCTRLVRNHTCGLQYVDSGFPKATLALVSCLLGWMWHEVNGNSQMSIKFEDDGKKCRETWGTASFSGRYFRFSEDQSDSQCVQTDTAMCAPLKGPYRQNSQIPFVILAHTHTFSPRKVEELKEKTFPFNFSHDHTERRLLTDTVGLSLHLHRKYSQGNVPNVPINKDLGTFCGIWTFKHETYFVL